MTAPILTPYDRTTPRGREVEERLSQTLAEILVEIWAREAAEARRAASA